MIETSVHMIQSFSQISESARQFLQLKDFLISIMDSNVLMVPSGRLHIRPI